MSFGICTPEWAKFSDTCPYGEALHLPGASLTIPKDANFVTQLAVVYSLLPAVGNIACVLVALWRRKSREAAWLVFIALQQLVWFFLRGAMHQERPRSCLRSCGMPSGHSVWAAGVFTLLLWHTVISPPEPSPFWRFNSCPPPRTPGLRLLGLCVIFLPIPWSRAQLGDHSPLQVCTGMLVGASLAVFWLRTLSAKTEAMLVPLLAALRRRRAGVGDVVVMSTAQPVLDTSLLETEMSDPIQDGLPPPAGMPTAQAADGPVATHQPLNAVAPSQPREAPANMS
eukprot:TRINITY_DN62452_c0_g1_i1.p1 TRINITY_DN62452_c0_g1~~TRINITY_DN62452_c0_g1_i1.p1  ORF type:complete len:283 (-),score=47.16 TRINITY_DN62452_c0_g1_i1:64-912(-)